MNGALTGTRILDLSRVLAGPWATQLLADYGADVIKVERPRSGDDTRHWGPPWIHDARTGEEGDAAYFLAANRNKRSITLDLGNAAAQDVLRRLVSRSDVVVDNFRPGTLERHGLDPAALMTQHPRLIWCCISAYGPGGARAAEPGYDAMIQAAGGLMSITGAPDEEGGTPQKVGVAVADLMAGMYAATAVLAALAARQRSGHGQRIDVPLFDSQAAWLANQAMNWLVGGRNPERLGTAHPNIVPYQAFETADGWLMLAVGNDHQFRACAEALGCPELADSPRYATNPARVEHRRELVAMLARRFRQRPTDEWLERLRPRVPAGPISDIATVFATPRAGEPPLAQALPHPLAGEVPTILNPVRFSATPVEYRCAPPLLGQHTGQILAELGYSPDEICSLREHGAL